MCKHTAKLISVLFFGVLFIAAIAKASTASGTISYSNSFAWGEKLGWVNFAPTSTGSVYNGLNITDSVVTGYAWSRVYGWVNFAPDNGGVTNNCYGQLGGYAWSSQKGWINMSGAVINEDGKFTGIAGDTSSTAGRLNFSCSNCSVITDWRYCALRSPVCGDGIKSGSEACDNGNKNGSCPASCSTSCKVNSCGGGGGGGGYSPSNTTATTTAVSTTPILTEIIYKSDGKIADSNYVEWFNQEVKHSDIIRDGVIDIFDFNNLMVNWLAVKKMPADINSDGLVDILDFNFLMVYWGESEINYNKAN